MTDDFRYTERLANRHHRPAELGGQAMLRGGDERLKYLLYFLDLRDLRVLELGPRDGAGRPRPALHPYVGQLRGLRGTASARRDSSRRSEVDSKRYLERLSGGEP